MTTIDNILVLGSQNVNTADQFINRSQISPVQILDESLEIKSINHFNNWGQFGVASVAWEKINPFIFYISTGNALFTLNIKNGDKRNINLPDLQDIHEMDIIDGTLWISNTGNDEILCFDIKKNRIEERIKLVDLMGQGDDIKKKNTSKDYIEKFHCNQIFKGFDNKLWVLVHHHKGMQHTQKTIKTLIKLHGNGGVINLETGYAINLRLRAPHSVRKVGSNYWVFDSRRFSINIYSKKWDFLSTIETGGVGRGATVIGDLFYAGISPVRKRYSSLHTSGSTQKNKIEVFDIKSLKKAETIEINKIEQINNLYSVSKLQFKYLQNL